MGRKQYEAISGPKSPAKESKGAKVKGAIKRWASRGNPSTPVSNEVSGAGVAPISTEKFTMFTREEKEPLKSSVQSDYGTFARS